MVARLLTPDDNDDIEAENTQATKSPDNPGANPKVFGIIAAISSSDDLNLPVENGSQSAYRLKMTRPRNEVMATMRMSSGPLRYKAVWAWPRVGSDKYLWTRAWLET